KKTGGLGFDDFENKDEPKDTLPAVVRKTWRSACSFFKRGLRVLRRYAQKLRSLPPVFFIQMKSDGW
ncbi:MAG: hypothetical protein D3908_09560, partial [Candidatus Electrothrix sp. AUS4]|nr:hypothetical protein [Candidatus Electrothrix sp. AUS4]